MSQTTSILDQEPYFSSIETLVEQGQTNAAIVKSIYFQTGYSTSEAAIRRFRKRHGLMVPGQTGAFTRVNDDVAEAATEPTIIKPILDDPDTMLRERGLDPEEWVITHVSPNMYEGPNSAKAVEAGGPAKITYYQTKFTCQRKRPPELQIFAPRTDGWIAPSRPKRLPPERALVVVVGDQQAPFHDRNLHHLFCEWLRQNTPDFGVSLGDGVDFPDISRHQLDPDNTATVNECLQSGYDLFRGYVNSSPYTEWTKLIGNHDERIRNILLDKPAVRPLHDIKRPDTPESEGEKLLGLSHAMRLDELGIEVIDPHGKYDLAQHNLTDKLAVRHGWLARKGSGASSLATLEHLGYSIIVGHTHRQSVVHVTKHEIDGRIRTVTGVESGCMCRVEQIPDSIDGRIWPNYTPAPDWQQGFCTVEIYSDGFFNVDLAKYVNGTLMWRDQRYS